MSKTSRRNEKTFPDKPCACCGAPGWRAYLSSGLGFNDQGWRWSCQACWDAECAPFQRRCAPKKGASLESNERLFVLPRPRDAAEAEAGRALDVMIAHFLCGWEFDVKESLWRLGERERMLVPFYSTRIEDAWPLHERMLDRVDLPGDFLCKWSLDRIHASVLMPGIPFGSRTWSVNLGVTERAAFIVAPTAPLAICRAALFVACLEAEDGV